MLILEQILSFRSRPIVEDFFVHGSKQEVSEVVPHNSGRNSGVPIHIKSLMATALHYATVAFQWHTGY